MKFDVIFDCGGSITFQTAEYCHYYHDPVQAAEDVEDFTRHGSTEGWEGNEPEHRQEYDADTERNGGYRWATQVDLLDKTYFDWDWGHNTREFKKMYDRRCFGGREIE